MPAWLLVIALLPVVAVLATTRRRRAQAPAGHGAPPVVLADEREARSLERVAGVVSRLSSLADADRILAEACREAARIVDHASAVVLRPGPAGLEVAHAAGRDRPPSARLRPPATGEGRRIDGLGASSVVHALEVAPDDDAPAVLMVFRDARDGGDPVPFTPAETARLHLVAEVAARTAQNARLHGRLRLLRDEAEDRARDRARLSRRLAEAEHEERRRLAMLLHDGPQQTLASVGLILDACVDALAEGQVAEPRRLLPLAAARSREAMRDLRDLSSTLEPRSLREEGLAAAVSTLTHRLAEAHGVRFGLELAALDRVGRDQAPLVYAIIREAVANAMKHARPRVIDVRARPSREGALEVVVANDGRPMARSTAEDGRGQGLDAMRERAATLGAEIAWRPRPGGGTEVALLIGARAVPRAA